MLDLTNRPEFSGSLTPSLEGSPRSRCHGGRTSCTPSPASAREKTGEEESPSKP